MSDPKPINDAPIHSLIEFASSEDLEYTEAEARANLDAEGVDVDGFLIRLRRRIEDGKRRERLMWMNEARAKLEGRRARSSGRYADCDRAFLENEVLRRERAGQLTMAAHRNHREFTDEDLRTLLEDQDDLEDT